MARDAIYIEVKDTAVPSAWISDIATLVRVRCLSLSNGKSKATGRAMLVVAPKPTTIVHH